MATYFLVYITNSLPTLKSPQPKSQTEIGVLKDLKNEITTAI